VSQEYDRLRGLLVQFPEFQKDFQDYDSSEQILLEAVSKSHFVADRSYLERKFPSTPGRSFMSEEHTFVFMTPFPEHGHVFLPLLSVDLDFSASAVRPTVAIHALHFGLAKDNPTSIRCFAYRYDTPNRTVGDHDYFHVQFSWGHVKGRVGQYVDKWISKEDPAIPVDATDRVELFLSAVMALRNRKTGRREYIDEWTQAGLPLRLLLGRMALERWKPQGPAQGGPA